MVLERVKEAECNGNINVLMYKNRRMRCVKTVPRMVGGGRKEGYGGPDFNYDTL
jgi:hypothetical protein